jgi:hypothetical protein
MSGRSAAGCLLALLLLGCGGGAESGPRIYPVRGTVHYQGRPAGGVMVVFHRQDVEGSERSYGKTLPDGSFKLSTLSAGDGAPLGQYRITLTWPPTEDEEAPGLTDKLGGRYADPHKSAFLWEVKPEPNIIPPFELK